MDRTSPAGDGRADFDFLHGRWQVRNERLRTRLREAEDWEVFPAEQTCEPVLGGLGNVDAFLSQWRPPQAEEGFIGMTLRLFDLRQRQWRIWWAGNHDGVLEPPLSGGFEQGRGVFEGELEHQGRPVRARFVWDGISAHTAHWHQQFRGEDGRWESNWHMWLRRLGDDGRLLHQDEVVELRQYRTVPGRRDELIALFEREFIEPQEAMGMHLLGQFRDLDAPDRFTWLRGFPDHAIRASALTAFYDSPVWRRHREAANATLADNDDVWLLRPARAGSGLAMPAVPRPPAEAPIPSRPTASALSMGICLLAAPAEQGFLERFDRDFAPLLQVHGLELLGVYLSDATANGYPRLPVREGEHALVWFAGLAGLGRADGAQAGASPGGSVLADRERSGLGQSGREQAGQGRADQGQADQRQADQRQAYRGQADPLPDDPAQADARALRRLHDDPRWQAALAAALAAPDGLREPPQWRRLAATPRSELRGRPLP